MTPRDLDRARELVKQLTALGMDTSQLRRDLSEVEARSEGSPTEDDLRYVIPTVPPTTLEHFVDGEPQILSAEVLWPGMSYTLTPGQRAVLRETYGLTPTATVTVSLIECWPGTQHPRMMKVTSDLHVDPRHRKHVLTSCIIRGVGTFLRTASEFDSESVREKVFGLTPGSVILGRVFDLESVERWAVEDLTGVKVARRVEIVEKTTDGFVVVCQKTGNRAKVRSSDFFPLVEDYTRLHSTKKSRKSTKIDVSDEMAKLAKEFGL